VLIYSIRSTTSQYSTIQVSKSPIRRHERRACSHCQPPAQLLALGSTPTTTQLQLLSRTGEDRGFCPLPLAASLGRRQTCLHSQRCRPPRLPRSRLRHAFALKGFEYEVVFFAGDGDGSATSKKHRPGWGWFLQAYHVLSRAMRKRLQKLYIVHEKAWVRILTEIFSTIVSPKFRRKIYHCTCSWPKPLQPC
jgi:hypothetical protein